MSQGKWGFNQSQPYKLEMPISIGNISERNLSGLFPSQNGEITVRFVDDLSIGGEGLADWAVDMLLADKLV